MFFFQPLEVHLQPADLLEEFGGVGPVVRLATLAALGEEGLGPLEQGLLPVADERGVQAVLGRQLVGGAVALDRGQGDLGLERGLSRCPELA